MDELATLKARVELLREDAEEPTEPPAPVPHVEMPSVTAPTCLADGQLLLLLGEGSHLTAARTLAAVAGERAVRIMGNEGGPLAYDGCCSLQVLPWRPSAKSGFAAALRRDAEALTRPAADILSALQQAKEAFSTSDAPLLAGALEAAKAQADAAVAAAERMAAMVALGPRAHTAREAIREAARGFQVELPSQVAAWWTPERKEEEEAIFKLRTRRGPDGSLVTIPEEQLSAAEREQVQRLKQGLEAGHQLKLELQHMQQRLRTAIEDLEALLTPAALEALAVEALRSSGTVGVRRYATGQGLTVRVDGAWRDAEVERIEGVAHRVRIEGHGPEGRGATSVLLGLHPWNHAPRELRAVDFEALRAWWAASMREQHAHIRDTLTSQRLSTLQQCVAIEVVKGTASMRGEVSDARSLSAWLSQQHGERLRGEAVEEPCAALLTAGPAAGKTTVTSQVVVFSLGLELVPILVKVQRLQHRLKEAPAVFAAAPSYVDAFLSLEHPPPVYRFLRQALAARRALILLDGLDEAGGRRAEIESHVAGVLALQGHVLLCTSRPAGVDEERFAAFHRLRLKPLDEAQQQRALEQRLGATAGQTLLDYVRERMPRDETSALVTSNPLMLSMLASVFELRQGIDMPRTVAGLYATASSLMLDRDGGRGVSAAVQRLLRAVFFAAHVAQRREIEDWQLDEAALALDAPGLLARLHSRTARAQIHSFDGPAELGHYVEAVNPSQAPTAYGGQRGSVTEVANGRCKVALADGTICMLRQAQLRSSGVTEAVFRAQAMAACANELRAACDTELPEGAREALAEVRRRVAADSLPLLSLLQAEPLRLQSSHLSFQDYFAALALCEEGTQLSGAPPWQWSAWWANAVRLGSEMGDKFGQGLKRAAGKTGDKLELNQKLGGDRPTALRALAAMRPRSLSLRANGIGTEEVEVLAEMVRTNTSLTFLDLRYNLLRGRDCEVLSKALKARPDASPLSIDMEYQTV